MSENKVFHEKTVRLPRAERIAKILKNEVVYRKIQELAKNLDREIGSQVAVMVDIPLKAKFRDKQTGAVYVYEGAIQPFMHDDLTFAILEFAKKPLEEFRDMSYMVIREQLSRPDSTNVIGIEDVADLIKPKQFMNPPKMISGPDFIKYFAVGRWELLEQPKKIDPDDFAKEHNVLRKVND